MTKYIVKFSNSQVEFIDKALCEAYCSGNGIDGYETVEEAIDAVATMSADKNWIGLTRELYGYAALFQKSMRANPQGLNLFTTLLTEGKLMPDVSEEAVALAFQAMQLELTLEEITKINAIFQKNGFSVKVG